jgi:hypothetical protein
MIHYTREGHFFKLGLNLRRAKGGFVANWVWYDLATHKASCYRFRLRVHLRPRMLWTFSQWNVIDEHLAFYDLVPVNREWLEDTHADWLYRSRRGKAFAQFGP